MNDQQDDPYLWLEDVDGDRAMAWVLAQNATCESKLQGDPRYRSTYDDALALLTADDRIAYGRHRAGWVVNFWQDANHVRGILRRTALESYRSADPDWETLLDLDALAEAEGENWVYQMSEWLEPSYDRLLVHLSRGGGDAAVLREFDVESRQFVEDGFALAEAKQHAVWVDRDTLLVGTSHGGGPVNTSGYPRTIRRWRRGSSIDEAMTIYEAPEYDALLYAHASHGPDQSKLFILRFPDFFHQEVKSVDPSGTVETLQLPDDVDFQGFFRGRLLVLLRSDWSVGAQTFNSGALIAAPLDTLREGATPKPDALVTPGDRNSIVQVSTTRDWVLVQMLDEVTGRLVALQPTDAGWRQQTIDLPPNGSVNVTDSDDWTDIAMVNFESFLTPSTLYLLDGVAEPAPIQQLPARFATDGLVTEQCFATSADGTRVPYFLVRRDDVPRDGLTPTVLYGYGGFEVSLSPSYVGPLAKSWLEQGGAWAVANIRGGGEFGPSWHDAALKRNRQRAFDDFHAVAEHLIGSGITSASRLGIYGGSNGGLLVGVALTQRPDLYGAVVCAVPLLDMLRFHKLLAGASWIGEYGDPDNDADRAVLKRYSPYQNVRADKRYPPVFLCTSTKDDRVHPGHARKMAARMGEQGHDVLYFENIEGGHAGAANHEQQARQSAMISIFLRQTLGAHAAAD